jgi:Mce-associated membrane protein
MTDDHDGVMDDDGAPPLTAPNQPADPTLPAPSPAASTTPTRAAASQPTTDDHVVPPPAKPDKPTEILESPSAPAAASSTRLPLVPILAAATAILMILTILFGLMAFAPRIAPIKSSATKLAAKAMEEEEIETIARRFAKNFVSIDYRTIDADLKRMTADATGNFADQLRKTIAAIGTQFKKSKASSQAKALDSAVLSHENGSALVQVLLQRTKRNVDTKGSQTGNQIVNVTLVNTADGWKVDNLTQLGAEGS